jgi:hypothetical protein
VEQSRADEADHSGAAMHVGTAVPAAVASLLLPLITSRLFCSRSQSLYTSQSAEAACGGYQLL